MPVTRDKIRGLFLGTAIGDGLGMPVETFDRDRIHREYGTLKTYVSPAGHKWFTNELPGTTTDDTQLFLAIARAIAETGRLDLDAIAGHHIREYMETTKGWGTSTRDSVANLHRGVDWRESAVGPGVGNGVAMKIAPVGAYLAIKTVKYREAVNDIANIAMMTHKTSLAVSSGIAHAMAVCYVLTDENNLFSASHFIRAVVTGSRMGQSFLEETITQDNLTDRLGLLRDAMTWDEDKLIAQFGGGACYVYHSLPFSYAYFLKGPNDIETLYEVASAGGDTDSNASMVGGLLGAVNGMGIFPQHLIDGLCSSNGYRLADELLAEAERFCDKLGVTE
jgi:ADP-ribosylglycohydrolase